MSAHNHECLNCNTSLSGKYCVNCGQKADTHRITAKHFIAHDLLHGMFHIEKGLFYTMLQIFKKRGKTALEYISGQRIKYYNVFYLSLILLGLNILLVVYDHKLHPTSVPQTSGSVGNLYSFMAMNIKFLILGFMPLFALNTFILFGKKKHNYAEHVVAAGFCIVGTLTLALLHNVMDIVLSYDIAVFLILKVGMALLLILSPLFFYYPYARPHYTFLGYTWRILVFYIFFIVEFLTLVLLLNYFLTGSWEVDGQLQYS